MSDAVPETRDRKTGRFKLGHKAGGRPRGSRSKLSEDFLKDMHDLWRREGKAILERAAKEQPAALLRALTAVIPKEIEANLEANISVDLFRECREFSQAWALAREILSADEPPLLLVDESDESEQ